MVQELLLEDVQSWTAALGKVKRRIGPHFVRSEAQERALSYLGCV